MNANIRHTYQAIFLTFVPATVTLSLRLWGRWTKKVRWWYDDYLAIAAWMFAIGWDICLIIWITHGFGKHIGDLPEDKTTVLYYSKLLNWNLDLNYAFSLGSSKLSVLMLYWRVFGISTIRTPIKVLCVLSILWIIFRQFFTVFMCVPTRGFWDKTINAECHVNEQKFFFGSSLVHLLLDVAILCLPLWEVFRLRLEWLAKIGLVVTFACGILVCVASIIVLAPAFNYTEHSDDVTWNNVDMFIWATVEVNLAILAGSFPMLPAALIRIVKIVHPSMDSDHHNPLRLQQRSKHGIILTTISRMQMGVVCESAISLADTASHDHEQGNSTRGFNSMTNMSDEHVKGASMTSKDMAEDHERGHVPH